jgi:hypothetical protein
VGANEAIPTGVVGSDACKLSLAAAESSAAQERLAQHAGEPLGRHWLISRHQTAGRTMPRPMNEVHSRALLHRLCRWPVAARSTATDHATTVPTANALESSRRLGFRSKTNES